VAGRHARRPALWLDEHEHVSYGELNALANRVARLLVERRVGRGDVVCLTGEKTAFTFACIVGCLKIGALYCVLDPDGPVERLRKILSTARPRVLVADADRLPALREIAAGLDFELVDGDPQLLAPALNGLDDSDLPQTDHVVGDDPAYIMFTSGSTGFPKGAVMTHANVLNLIAWSAKTFSITEADVLTNVNPLYFDNSVFDIYSALFTGARLVPFSKAETTDPGTLADKCDTAGCTLWFSVPSLLIYLQTMKVADGTRLGSIRRFVFGGEGYPKAKLKRLYDAYARRSEFYNVYGPTECTCICSCYELTREDFADLRGLPPLGHIIDDFEYLIVDAGGEPVPAGEIGELCLMGPNVGRGYYDDPDRTAASFADGPMYRTGDLVRQDPSDGLLYFEGRRDNQVKHMGYRVELEEIEVALSSLDYVAEAAVLHTAANGLSRLVAVVAAQDLDRERIRADLGRIVPGYMIPAEFRCQERLPRNPNGKVDRRSLEELYL
jgi:D-alanine--poly(phosphoribitol) ligase subunit 1